MAAMPLAQQTQGDQRSGGSLPNTSTLESTDATKGQCPPVAIVGMALRLPGGITSPDKFWNFLMEKKNGVCDVPDTRYNVDAFYSEVRPHCVKTRRGYFLQGDPACFDPGFFGISGYEAGYLDPQQRQLLEVVWECLESAGETRWHGKRIGCYVGVYGEDWLDLASKDPLNTDRFHILGTGQFALANRLSFEFDFQGPSMTIQTGCSASLVGLHEACQALYSGDCSSAIVAGTNLMFGPTMTMTMSDNTVMSPTGACQTFDKKADGYGRGEAINALYVKLLDHAIRDNDPIQAVIRATSTNCDGKTPSITTPGANTQESLVRWAYEKANIKDIAETGFFECHGTGTQAGDQVEATAVAKLFGGKGVAIGSVKPSVGHGEGASGISSVIKGILALQHDTIPPNVFFEDPNPYIPFQEGNLHVPVEPEAWPKDRSKRVSVNCFGVGGANAHAILDAYPAACRKTASLAEKCEGPRVLVVSARSSVALQKRFEEVGSYIEKHPGRLHDLAYTLSQRREHLSHRAFAVVDPAQSMEQSSLSFHSGRDRSPALTYVFTGQGAQWPGMGRDLIRGFPEVRSSIQSLDRELQRLPDAPDWSLEDELQKIGDASRVGEAAFSQPLCTAIQIALVDLLHSWDIRPSSVVGHSSGEIAAAYAAGALTSKSAIVIAYYRGKMAKSQEGKGAMAAVGLGPAKVSSFLEEGVVIACQNSPQSVTLSGDQEKVDNIICRINAANPDIFCRRLNVSIAYHSHHMRAFGAEYESRIAPFVQHNKTMLPFFSSVTTSKITDFQQLDASYWRRNLESPVLFSTAVEGILQDTQGKAFLEIGPHSALSGPLRQIFQESEIKIHPVYIPTLVRNDEDSRLQLMSTAGSAHIHGLPVSLGKINGSHGKTLSDIPSYPWDHSTRYWHDSRITRDWRFRKYPHHELLGARIMESSDLEPSWRNLLRLEEVQWLADHALQGDVIFPGMGYVAVAGEAIRQLNPDRDADDYSIKNMVIKSPLLLKESHTVEVLTSLKPVPITDLVDGDWYSFSIISNDGTGWTKHCQGQVMAGSSDSPKGQEVPKYSRIMRPDICYKFVERLGFYYGPIFQRFEEITIDPTHSRASAIVLDFAGEPASHYTLHPATMDHALQLFPAAIAHGVGRSLKIIIPSTIGHIYVARRAPKVSIHASILEESAGFYSGDAVIMAGDDVIMTFNNVHGFPMEGQDNQGERGIPCTSQMQWAPDIDLMPLDDLFPQMQTEASHIEMRNAAEKLSALYILETAALLNESVFEGSQFLMWKNWVTSEASKLSRGQNQLHPEATYLAALTSEDRQLLIEDIWSQFDRGERNEFLILAACMRYICQNCREIMDNEILSEETERHIEDFTDLLWSDLNWVHFLKALGHSNPGMRVLEIGAGTGFITKRVLTTLQSTEDAPLYARYVYSNPSEDAIADAQKKTLQNIEFRQLDITKDPTERGLAPQSFDLIIAFNTLWPTTESNAQLRNVHQLLSPQGRLLVHQLSPESLAHGYILRLIPDKWIEEQKDGFSQPYVSLEDWDSHLRATGFSGNNVNIHYRDFMSRHTGFTIMSNSPQQLSGGEEITLLVNDTPGSWARSLASYLVQKGYKIQWATLHQDHPKNDWVISLLDLDGPYLRDLSEKSFITLQTYLTSLTSNKTLWVTKLSQISCDDPDFGLILGLLRTLRQEDSLDISTFETDAFDEHAIDALSKVLRKLIASRQANQANGIDPEYEFAYYNGDVLVGRCYWGKLLDNNLTQQTESIRRKLDFSSFGLIETLEWVPYEARDLPSGHVEVKMHYVGLNFRDVLVGMGFFGTPDEFGVEGSGTICRIAPDVVTFKPGDRVAILGEGILRTHAILPALQCIGMPDDYPFEDATTLPSAYATVAYCLLHLCRLRKGDSTLIHSACGGVGIAAIHVCKRVGAEIYATVGSEEKVQHLVNTLGIPRHRIFNSRSAEFYHDVMRETNGRGVDVVLNSLSGNLLHVSWDCVAPFGKMVELGKRDFIGHGKLDMLPFIKNRSYFGFDMVHVGRENHEVMKDILKYFYNLHVTGGTIPIRPVTVYDAGNVVDAFRYMQKGFHMGKILIRIPEDVRDFPASSIVDPVSFPTDASYLLVGGMGGVGPSMSTWMVERGARSFVYLSRSVGSSEDNKNFIHELEDQGCSVVCVQGDVTNEMDVKRAIAACPRPLTGVLQMSGSLEDCTFGNMTHEQWTSCLAPKVKGTWNLHHATREEKLDFFVVLSSVAATCGNPGQANYAAANTFLDSFTQYRRGLGLPTGVINLGPVEDFGMASQNQDLLDRLRHGSVRLVNETEAIEGLQTVIQQARNLNSFAKNTSSPCIVGLGTTRPLSDPSVRRLWGDDARFSIYANLSSLGSTSIGVGSDEIKILLRKIEKNPSILNDGETERIIMRELGQKITQHKTEAAELDEDELADLVIDSLMAIEIRGWARRNMGIEISLVDIGRAGTVRKFAATAIEQLKVRFGLIEEKELIEEIEPAE